MVFLPPGNGAVDFSPFGTSLFFLFFLDLFKLDYRCGYDEWSVGVLMSLCNVFEAFLMLLNGFMITKHSGIWGIKKCGCVVL
jgi:hypothetical protein